MCCFLFPVLAMLGWLSVGRLYVTVGYTENSVYIAHVVLKGPRIHGGFFRGGSQERVCSGTSAIIPIGGIRRTVRL